MSNEIVTERPASADAEDTFVRLLAGTSDGDRAALLARVKLRAMNDAPAESFQTLRTESLADVAAGDLAPPPVLVPGVIVEGQVNWLAGHPAHGKTTVGMYAALIAARDGRDVLWIDWEGGKLPTARRLVAMGATAADFSHFHYVGFPRLGADGDALRAVGEVLDRLSPGALVVFDSASKALSMAGLEENSPSDATRWTSEVVMPLRERATVVVIDHVTKGATRSTPYARGAGSKLADTEVLWFVEAEEKFDREHVGVILLTKHKDREGVLPPRVRFRVGDGKGKLPVERIDVTEDGGAGARVSSTRAEVLDLLRRHDGEALTGRQVEGMVAARAGDVRAALKALVSDPSEPVSAAPGERRSILYRLDASAVTAAPMEAV